MAVDGARRIADGSTVTGEPSGHDFMRASYCVHNHGDGTGTIILDWYETSEGCDFCTYDRFMRTNIESARKIVALLNEQLPGRVTYALTEIDMSGQPDDEIPQS